MGSTKPDKTLLTPREAEIQELHKSGMSRKDIAAQLGISYKTVCNHMDSIRIREMEAREK
jgi:DNA-binding NarL/FixJ family response regulator